MTTVSMIGIGAPLALAAAVTGSITATAVLFGLSGIFIGPFAAALFTTRTEYADAAVRTQVFTIGAGLKVSASAFGAALIGLLTGLPICTQLLLVATSPLLAGLVGTMLLIFSPATNDGKPKRPLIRPRAVCSRAAILQHSSRVADEAIASALDARLTERKSRPAPNAEGPVEGPTSRN